MSQVLYEKRDRIAYVTINRPEAKNAVDPETHELLWRTWEDFRDDPDLWVAILTGAGERAFCAGNDLKVTAQRTANGGDVQGDARQFCCRQRRAEGQAAGIPRFGRQPA